MSQTLHHSAQSTAQPLHAEPEQRISVLCDTVDCEVGNGTSEINIGIVMVLVAMRPVAVELKNSEQDAKHINSNLQDVGTVDEA